MGLSLNLGWVGVRLCELGAVNVRILLWEEKVLRIGDEYRKTGVFLGQASIPKTSERVEHKYSAPAQKHRGAHDSRRSRGPHGPGQASRTLTATIALLRKWASPDAQRSALQFAGEPWASFAEVLLLPRRLC